MVFNPCPGSLVAIDCEFVEVEKGEYKEEQLGGSMVSVRSFLGDSGLMELPMSFGPHQRRVCPQDVPLPIWSAIGH